MRGTLVRSSVPDSRVTLYCEVCSGQTGKNLKNRDNPQLTWLPCLFWHSWAVQRSLRCGCVGLILERLTCLRYGLRPSERMQSPTGLHKAEKCVGVELIITRINEVLINPKLIQHGSTELACGSQAFIATLLFDPSMSALPIIPKQNSVSVGLFTH